MNSKVAETKVTDIVLYVTWVSSEYEILTKTLYIAKKNAVFELIKTNHRQIPPTTLLVKKVKANFSICPKARRRR